MDLFLCYRRDDSSAATEQLRDWLETFIGTGHVFMDFYDVPLAVNWRDVVANKISSSQAVLVIIGKQWLNQNLNDPDNATRFEIELALQHQIPLIPVLIEKAEMPSARGLPSSITEIAHINAARMRVGPDRQQDRERLRQAIEEQTHVKLHTSDHSLERQLRTTLIRLVRAQIDEGIQAGLHDLVEIELGLTRRPGIIEPTWGRVNPIHPRYQIPVPAGVTLASLFDEQQSLVILGEPGSGKTTLLLTLAHTLIRRVSNDATQTTAIPLFLNLNTWALAEQPMQDWLIERLQRDYYLDKTGSTWVVDHLPLVILLDGLDEVAAAKRTACVHALNAYFNASGQQHPLAITSRLVEFEELFEQGTKLNVSTAVQVQSLTSNQITDFLDHYATQLAGAKEAIERDAGLKKLVHTPLWLNLLAVTYADQAANYIPHAGSLNQLKQQLFQAYVDTRLNPQWRPRLLRPERHRTPNEEIAGPTKEIVTPSYQPLQVRQWLTWIATTLKAEGVTSLYLEALQPSVLSKTTAKTLYKLAVIIIFVFGATLLYGIVASLAFGFAAGLYAGIIGGFIGVLFIMVRTVIVYIIRIIFLHKKNVGTVPGIRLHDQVKFSWPSFNRGLKMGSLIGVISILVSGLGLGIISGGKINPIEILIFAFSIGILIGFDYVLIFGIESGTSEYSEDISKYKEFNLGVKRTGLNGLRVGLRSGIASGPLIGLIAAIIFGPRIGISVGFGVGLTLSIDGAMDAGVADYIKHWLIRVALVTEKAMPLRNYSEFLLYCVDRNLLKQIGNGIEFIHPLLRDFFATRTPVDSESSSL